MKNRFLIALCLGIAPILALAQPAHAGDDYQETHFIECGDSMDYGLKTAVGYKTLFSLEYLDWANAEITGTTMGMTHFTAPEDLTAKPSSIQEGCHVTQAQLGADDEGDTLTLSNPDPKQGCKAVVTGIKDSAFYAVEFTSPQGATDKITNCALKFAPGELIKKLKAMDKDLSILE